MASPTSPRDSKRWHDPAPLSWSNPVEWSRKLAEVANGIMQGRTNNRGTITLSVSQAGGAVIKTPIVDSRIGGSSVLNFMATTASARSQGAVWISSLTDGGCWINHISTDSADAIFDYVVWS